MVRCNRLDVFDNNTCCGKVTLFSRRLDGLWGGRKRRWISLFGTLLETFFFSTFFSGFNALIQPYIDVGTFGELCDETDCTRAEQMFGYAYITALCFQMCSAPLSGILMDQIGLRITKLVGVSIYFIGCLMFAFVRAGTSYLIFPAMIFGAVGAYASVLCNLHVASVFPVWRGMIISGLNGAYESSSAFAFVIAKTSPSFALRDSFILLGCFALVAGCLVSTFILTQRTTDMKKLAKHTTPGATTPGFVDEQEDSVYDREVERLIQYYYPDKKSCFLSEAYTMAYLYFLPGVLRFSLYFSQLDQQLLYSFTHEHEVVNKLLLASSYTSMCAILLSPFTGLVIDYSRRVARQKLESMLVVSDLKPRRIYWYHMCALAPTLFLLATLSLYISCTLYITGQQWVYYTQFVAIVFMGSILPSVTNTFIMTAFPLKYFGTLMGVLSLIGGIFSLVQFGLIQLPIAIGNGFMVVSSVIMFIPPIFLFIGAN